MDSAALVINSGSSSVKFALFGLDDRPRHRLLSGAVERIGLPSGRVSVVDRSGASLLEEAGEIVNHSVAIARVMDWIEGNVPGADISAVGHRIVHGGPDHFSPILMSQELEGYLTRIIPLAPLHLPHNLAGIAAVRSHKPGIPQVATFDTAFHKALPPIARMTGLPPRLEACGLRRYGFHGLSYEYVVRELRRRHGSQTDDERIIIAHLGNGASMAAIRGGRSVDTTMGFSTLAGLPMGTRSGDIDPGLILYLLDQRAMTVAEVSDLLYEGCGLLGLSSSSRNMQDLLQTSEDEPAERAIQYFCYQARRHLAGLTAVLEGLDCLVFTGGIGAKAPEIRTRICGPLGYLGIELDPVLNRSGDRAISARTSRVRIEAFQTDEELVIADHVRDVICSSQGQEDRSHA